MKLEQKRQGERDAHIDKHLRYRKLIDGKIKQFGLIHGEAGLLEVKIICQVRSERQPRQENITFWKHGKTPSSAPLFGGRPGFL